MSENFRTDKGETLWISTRVRRFLAAAREAPGALGEAPAKVGASATLSAALTASSRVGSGAPEWRPALLFSVALSIVAAVLRTRGKFGSIGYATEAPQGVSGDHLRIRRRDLPVCSQRGRHGGG